MLIRHHKSWGALELFVVVLVLTGVDMRVREGTFFAIIQFWTFRVVRRRRSSHETTHESCAKLLRVIHIHAIFGYVQVYGGTSKFKMNDSSSTMRQAFEVRRWNLMKCRKVAAAAADTR